MSLSKAFMNSGTLPSLSAAAMAVKTSMMSAWVSAKRHATAIVTHAIQRTALTVMRTPGVRNSAKTARASACATAALRTITGINLNVLFREVARPEARTGRAAAVKEELNQAIF